MPLGGFPLLIIPIFSVATVFPFIIPFCLGVTLPLGGSPLLIIPILSVATVFPFIIPFCLGVTFHPPVFFPF